MQGGLHKIFSMQIGGSRDTAALTALGAAAVMTAPGLDQFHTFPGSLAPILLAAGGAGMLTDRIYRAVTAKPVLAEKPIISSSELPEMPPGEDGLNLGFTVDRGEALIVPYEFWTRHALLAGQTGVGKTVLGSWLMYQHMRKNGGILFIDGKCDLANLEDFYKLCVAAGREADLRVISPTIPDKSNTYNPILRGTPTQVASRIASLIPSAENNPGADHYRQAAIGGLTAIVGAAQALGMAYNFSDLSIMITNARAMEDIENRLRAAKGLASKETRQFSLFLDQFRAPKKPGEPAQLDMKKIKDLFGGIADRMNTFSNTFGVITDSYNPEVSMYDAIRRNEIIYVMLPTLGQRESALVLGKMLVADLRTAVADIYDGLPKDELPNPPFLAFMDEAGSYAGESWADPFQQFRGARVILMPAIQTFANLESVSPEFSQMIQGNTWTKIFMKLSVYESAEAAANLIGMEMKVVRARAEGSTGAQMRQALRVAPEANLTRGATASENISEQEDFKVSPSAIMGLPMGEAIVTYGGDRVYHIKIPRALISKELSERAGSYRLNRIRKPRVQGLDLFENAEKYLSKVE